MPLESLPAEEWCRRLGTGPSGLTAGDAASRLKQFGPNQFAGEQRSVLLQELLSLVSNPLVLVLLLAGAVAAATGEMANAALIIGIVLVSMFLDFTQSYRSRKAAEELKRSVVTTATVVRDGTAREVPLREIVPGDVFQLSAGSLVPADGVLWDATDLFVNEAALTGESIPASKSPAGRDGSEPVFLGTSVVSGIGTALAVRTGSSTQFGQVARHLTLRPPASEFERGIRQFGLLITRTVVFLVLFVFFVQILGRHDPREAFLFALALAVGLTPEFLPMIISVTLAQGAVRMSRHRVIVKQLAAMENFGSMDVLCTDKTGTLTEGRIVLARYLDLHGRACDRALELASLNSAFQTGLRSPLDEAVLRHEHPAIDAHRKVAEIPFDFARRRLSVVVTDGARRLLITKGAPESVVPGCVAYAVDSQELPLDGPAKEKLEALFRSLSSEGYRVIALAVREVAEQTGYGIEDERELAFVGLLAFLDPPRPDVKETLAALLEDGVRVKILTGDNELVTRKICEEVGLTVERVVLGRELESMSDAALAAVADEATFFARVSPEQKNRILLALKHRGHVVGFMGDGINDAPSLRTADVGISVCNAVDVAKEAAHIILLEPSLGALHAGVIEGRKSFGNILKYVLMGTSSNFGNMFSMAGAALLLRFLPLLPTQILLNNLLYDISQVTIPNDSVDASFVRKPRRWDVGFIRRFMLVAGPVSSFYDYLTFAVMLWGFHAGEALFRTGWFVESLATQTLVIFVLRTSGSPFRSRPAQALVFSVLACVAAAVVLPYTPLAPYLGFVPLPLPFFVVLAVMTLTYLALVQQVKRWIFADQDL